MRRITKRHVRSDRPARSAQGGFALITVLLVLVLLSGLTAVAHLSTRSNVRIGANSAASTEAYYAAEAGGEHILASIKSAMGQGVLTQAAVDDAMGEPPDIPGYEFTEYSATVRPDVVPEKITDGPYAGMWSLTRYLDIVSSVEGRSGTRSRVEITARALAIPIFQFASFYDDDLEIFPGPDMTLGGRVHTNADLFMGAGSTLDFGGMITAAGDLHLHRKFDPTVDTHGDDVNVLLKDGTTWADIDADHHDFGTDTDFVNYSENNWDNNIRTQAHGIEEMGLPLPTGMDPYELIEKCDAGDPAAVKALKYHCNADIVVSNTGPTADVESGLTGAKKANFADFNQNAFYDARDQPEGSDGALWQSSNRDVLELDISVLDASDTPAVIYVYANPGSITNGVNKQVVVRVNNAATLPGPVSIATNRPLYVNGDFNSDPSNWHPASLVGDAITILSNDWVDADNQDERWEDQDGDGLPEAGEGPDGSGDPGDAPEADTETIVRAAILAGHSATDPGNEAGGQFENFPRFLEDWDVDAVIEGSFVSLWNPTLATGRWSCCDPIYVPPGRKWTFDDRLKDPANLPPNTPVVGRLMRVGFTRGH